MSSAAARSVLPGATLDDLLALPEEERGEIVDGVLLSKEAASGKHGEAQGRMFQRLGPFNRRPGGPPERPGGWRFATDVLVDFGAQQKRRPDVAGWRRERLAEMPHVVPITIIPDWICEVLSSNRADDLVKKMRLYHQAQVPHYWIIDPEVETLSVYRWVEGGYLHVLGATRNERVRAEPFAAIELSVSAFFGDDDDEAP